MFPCPPGRVLSALLSPMTHRISRDHSDIGVAHIVNTTRVSIRPRRLSRLSGLIGSTWGCRSASLITLVSVQLTPPNQLSKITTQINQYLALCYCLNTNIAHWNNCIRRQRSTLLVLRSIDGVSSRRLKLACTARLPVRDFNCP